MKFKTFALVVTMLVATTACSTSALAAPCAGFDDVDSASAFCPNVTWMKNRGVTMGCASNLYCPNDAVSRLAMAAFINRLQPQLPPTYVDANDSVVGPHAFASDNYVPVKAWAIFRTGGEAYALLVEQTQQYGSEWTLKVFAELYFDLPGCIGQTFVDRPGSHPIAPQPYALVRGPAMEKLLYKGTGPMAIQVIYSTRSPNGSCQNESSARAMSLAPASLVENLSMRFTEPLRLK